MSSEYKITLEEQSPLDEGAERAGKVGMLHLQNAFANAYRHGYEDGQKAATPAEHNETSAILAAAEAPTRIADLESRTPANEVQNAKRSWNVCPLCGELADVPDECMPGARFKCSDCGTDLYAEYFTDGTWQLLLASDVDGPECPRHKGESVKDCAPCFDGRQQHELTIEQQRKRIEELDTQVIECRRLLITRVEAQRLDAANARIAELEKRLADTCAAHKCVLEDMANTRAALNQIAQIVSPGMAYDRPADVVEAVGTRLAIAKGSEDVLAELRQILKLAESQSIRSAVKRMVEVPTVDGKTPEEIYHEIYVAEYGPVANAGALPWQDVSIECKRAIRLGCHAVLRAFGGAALRRVRERIQVDGLRIFEGEKHGIDAISCAVAMIDAELAEPGPEIAECQPSAVDVLRRVRKSIRETLPAARDAGSVWKIEEERVYAIIDDELATLGATITDTSKPTKPAAIEPTPQDLTDPKKPTKPGES